MKIRNIKKYKDSINYFDLTTPKNHNYVLENGVVVHNCGVGYSVERQEIQKLPVIPDELYPTDTTIIVRDSKLGWVQGLNELISLLYSGRIPKWDLSLVRPAGARLKTFGGRACLTGDTIVYKDRKKSRGYNEITIKELFDMKTTGRRRFHDDASQDGCSHIDMIRLRSLDEESGMFFRNRLVDVVDNGIAPVYEVLTESGYRIRATDNHRFMNDLGEYMFLSDFLEGDYIAVNGSKEKKTGCCCDCHTSISRRAMRCKPCSDRFQQKTDCSYTTARARKECQQNKKDCCESCNKSDIELHIHHIDHNPRNNVEGNLLTLCESCHRQTHAKENTFGNPYSHRYLSFDRIISITYVGTEQVFDLVMEGPNHNFVANGFVSHNSGPDPINQLFTQVIATFKKAVGRRLNSLECHTIATDISAAVLCGGVRRCCFSDSTIELEDRTWKRFGDVEVGDKLYYFGDDCEVLEVEHSEQETFEIILEDGTSQICTKEHRWPVYNHLTNQIELVFTEDLENGEYSLLEME